MFDESKPYATCYPGTGPKGEKYKQGSRWYGTRYEFLYDEQAQEPEPPEPTLEEMVSLPEPKKRGRPRKVRRAK